MNTDNINLSIKLKDDRQLGYVEYGDPTGQAVIYFQGSPGSRLQAKDFDEVASIQHCRLISVDRPGMGLSSFNENHTILNWANDIIELADALKINLFSKITCKTYRDAL